MYKTKFPLAEYAFVGKVTHKHAQKFYSKFQVNYEAVASVTALNEASRQVSVLI